MEISEVLLNKQSRYSELTQEYSDAQELTSELESTLLDVNDRLYKAHVQVTISPTDEGLKGSLASLTSEKEALTQSVEQSRKATKYIKSALRQLEGEIKAGQHQEKEESRGMLRPIVQKELEQTTARAREAFADYLVLVSAQHGALTSNIDINSGPVVSIFKRSDELNAAIIEAIQRFRDRHGGLPGIQL